MTNRQLIEGWVVLIVLSLCTTALTLVEVTGAGRLGVAGVILILAGLKAHIILKRYLQLGSSVFWMRAFDFTIFGFLLLGYGLFALEQVRP